ncbi:hypothetical protein CCACVL1_02276, partial [Corchorus capsularis]
RNFEEGNKRETDKRRVVEDLKKEGMELRKGRVRITQFTTKKER